MLPVQEGMSGDPYGTAATGPMQSAATPSPMANAYAQKRLRQMYMQGYLTEEQYNHLMQSPAAGWNQASANPGQSLLAGSVAGGYGNNFGAFLNHGPQQQGHPVAPDANQDQITGAIQNFQPVDPRQQLMQRIGGRAHKAGIQHLGQALRHTLSTHHAQTAVGAMQRIMARRRAGPMTGVNPGGLMR